MEPERFDAIVLGTGQAGKPLALDLGGAGRRTAVVEREHVGDRRRRHDPLGGGQPATWRLLFIKIAAEVVVSQRRILVRLSASWPYLHYFQKVCTRLVNRLQTTPYPTG